VKKAVHLIKKWRRALNCDLVFGALEEIFCASNPNYKMTETIFKLNIAGESGATYMY
jgi:hypothetical protein